MSTLEDILLGQIEAAGLPAPIRQLMFAKDLNRRWLFDFSWVFPNWFAVECDGGTFLPGGGGHSSGQGQENDCVKMAVATLLGWRVYRVNTHMVADGRALTLIKGFLHGDEAACATAMAQTRCHSCDLTKTRRRQKARAKASKK